MSITCSKIFIGDADLDDCKVLPVEEPRGWEGASWNSTEVVAVESGGTEGIAVAGAVMTSAMQFRVELIALEMMIGSRSFVLLAVNCEDHFEVCLVVIDFVTSLRFWPTSLLVCADPIEASGVVWDLVWTEVGISSNWMIWRQLHLCLIPKREVFTLPHQFLVDS